MYPTQFLVVMILLPAAVLALQLRARARRASQLRALAASRHMHFSPQDRFGLAARVAALLPTPGAADVRVSDLLYRSDELGHQYLFTADHTRGVLGAKRRYRNVLLLTEPHPFPGREPTPTLHVAPDEGTTLSQYQSLLPPPV